MVQFSHECYNKSHPHCHCGPQARISRPAGRAREGWKKNGLPRRKGHRRCKNHWDMTLILHDIMGIHGILLIFTCFNSTCWHVWCAGSVAPFPTLIPSGCHQSWFDCGGLGHVVTRGSTWPRYISCGVGSKPMTYNSLGGWTNEHP